MDELLPKLALVTQKVNNYTGTDYSGIEALRREIREQGMHSSCMRVAESAPSIVQRHSLTTILEELVKSRRRIVEEAKQAMDAALAQQSSSQKEIVRLLERKNSWLDSELERYMSLIRSEHVNEQAVSAAKDAVLVAEASLEETRSHLEKRERAQYHEEQIWSDTIRRNSTWVTFGLMGVNIFLLLASLVVIEPWRRRRLVREVRRALDEQNPVPVPTIASAAPTAPVAVQSVENAIDSVVEPAGITLESIADADNSTLDSPPMVEATTPPQAIVAAADDSNSREFTEAIADGTIETSAEPPLLVSHLGSGATSLHIPTPPNTWQQRLTNLIQQYREYFLDLFSERLISIKRVDLTSATLEGAAAGAVLMSLLLLLAKPR
jgi:sensitive to high expression protein 9